MHQACIVKFLIDFKAVKTFKKSPQKPNFAVNL